MNGGSVLAQEENQNSSGELRYGWTYGRDRPVSLKSRTQLNGSEPPVGIPDVFEIVDLVFALSIDEVTGFGGQMDSLHGFKAKQSHRAAFIAAAGRISQLAKPLVERSLHGGPIVEPVLRISSVGPDEKA